MTNLVFNCCFDITLFELYLYDSVPQKFVKETGGYD